MDRGWLCNFFSLMKFISFCLLLTSGVLGDLTFTTEYEPEVLAVSESSEDADKVAIPAKSCTLNFVGIHKPDEVTLKKDLVECFATHELGTFRVYYWVTEPDAFVDGISGSVEDSSAGQKVTCSSGVTEFATLETEKMPPHTTIFASYPAMNYNAKELTSVCNRIWARRDTLIEAIVRARLADSVYPCEMPIQISH